MEAVVKSRLQDDKWRWTVGQIMQRYRVSGRLARARINGVDSLFMEMMCEFSLSAYN